MRWQDRSERVQMAKPKTFQLIGARIKRPETEPRTLRAYVEVYGVMNNMKSEPIIVARITEDRAVMLAEELLTTSRQVRKSNG